MNRYFGGLLAGWSATLAISILILLKRQMGLEPQLELVGMPAQTLGVGIEAAWFIHVLIGTTWGFLFAMFGEFLPGKHWTVRGLAFGAMAWLAMMLWIMPMAGAGHHPDPAPGVRSGAGRDLWLAQQAARTPPRSRSPTRRPALSRPARRLSRNGPCPGSGCIG